MLVGKYSSTLGGASNNPSCAPPAQTSSFLTIGAPDANGAPANSVASVRLTAIVGGAGPPEDSDVAIEINVTDVRCKTGVSTCGAANSQAGADYTGELTPNAAFRLTDANNGGRRVGSSDGAGPFLAGSAQVQVPCTATASTAIGATCAWTTTLDAVNPGIVLDGKRAVWQIGQVEVLDGGSDGEASTTPNSRFLVQGIYAP